MRLLQREDEELAETMIKGAITGTGEMAECLSVEKGEIVMDKRILYLISYKQFQRQYYFNHELLRKELEERMNTKVVLRHENTAKGNRKAAPYNAEDIWENIEDLRQEILKGNVAIHWEKIIGKSNGPTYSKKIRKTICEIREQEHLIRLLKEMDKAGITGELAFKILTSCKQTRKIKKYEKLHRMIITNQLLDKFTGNNIEEIPFYNRDREEKIQAAIYCYLKKEGQASYKVTDELAGNIIRFYKSAFPLSTKLPTVRMVKGRMKQMYRSKGKGSIRNELRLKTYNIFELEEADY